MVEHRAQVGVECPQCHGRQFVEVQLDRTPSLEQSALALEIRRQLEAWMASHCPEHLTAISKFTKN